MPHTNEYFKIYINFKLTKLRKYFLNYNKNSEANFYY